MNIPANPWKKKRSPKRILAIRLQAMGDVVITLPYLQDLRNSLPASVQIDLLTRCETDPIPKNLVLFNNVFSIAGKRSLNKQLFFALLLIPRLLLRRYDIVIDLQNNSLSRLIRKTLMPSSWSEFDRTSPIPAGFVSCEKAIVAKLISNAIKLTFLFFISILFSVHKLIVL